MGRYIIRRLLIAIPTLIVISFVYSLSLGAAAGFAGWYIVRFVARFTTRHKRLEAAVAQGRAAANK